MEGPMHGCEMNHHAGLGFFFFVLLTAGCGETGQHFPEAPANPVGEAHTSFDARSAATVSGTVRWKGPILTLLPFEVRSYLSLGDPLTRPRLVRENPNAPVIDGPSRGVSNAVVFLRGLDPGRARPWDHASVRVE